MTKSSIKLAAFTVAILGLLVLSAGIWLGRDGPDTAASSGSLPNVFVASLAPREELCRANQIIPPGADRVEMTISTFGRPVRASALIVGSSDQAVLRGRRSFTEGQNVDIRFAPVSASERIVDLCIRNVGRTKFQLAGTPDGGVSVRFPVATRFTWLEVGGDIARRFQLARVAPFGAATLWIALALGLAGVVVGLGAVFKASRS
ncbi:MAG: hypothetical protein WCK06_09025 [Actinomycetota bacterium]